ncbi:uncharacterized protein DSM5745_02012 [Aspergillus mulundensis]|uniref:Uncharacterized protein n=1 Tax=Aspergillus mulundensis TaxID=1810919 RepID=A0A3D8SV91_9EURO|nr:hypothetical protein DSM5745_02012 [Aspergillus mulundensis]RDW90237.1 hypothetical protein DSM5745_02012 [Aspergillus mulundensis]
MSSASRAIINTPNLSQPRIRTKRYTTMQQGAKMNTKPIVSKITETEGDLFDAPDGTALIHACNCIGSWGAGIARVFRTKYPAAYRIYESHCRAYIKDPQYRNISASAATSSTNQLATRNTRLPEATTLIIPPQRRDYERPRGRKHWIICLFTSRGFGRGVSGVDVILQNTELAVADLKEQLDELEERELGPEDVGITELRACRFNSGLFGVKWALTKRILEESGLEILVVRPPSEEGERTSIEYKAMPPERQPAQKRRTLPFKPPSRAAGSASTTTAGTSKAKAKPTAKVTKPGTKAKKTTATTSSSKPKPAKASSSRQKPSPSPAGSETDSDPGSASDDSDRDSPNASASDDENEANYILAEITHVEPEHEDVLSAEPLIPSKLLTKLVHHHFRNEKTKIAKDANAVVAKYIDVFVREAVARATHERVEAQGGAAGGGGIGDGFLEVEDLEKMAPQLAMDF